MKRLFESDSAARVGGVGCPSDMMAKLDEVLSSCQEEFALEYNWANWDIEGWLSKMCPTEESLWDRVKLALISFDNVFRCFLSQPHQYVRPQLIHLDGPVRLSVCAAC